MLVLVSMLNLTYLRTTSYNTATLPPVEAQVGERSKAAQKNHICVIVLQVLLQESGIALDRKRCTQQKNDKTIIVRSPRPTMRVLWQLLSLVVILVVTGSAAQYRSRGRSQQDIDREESVVSLISHTSKPAF